MGRLLSVTNGESYYVQNQEIKPSLTNKRTDLHLPEPTQPPSNFTQGNDVDSSGNPVGFILTGTPNARHSERNFADCINPELQSGLTVVFDANGKLLNFGTIVPYLCRDGR